MYRVALLALLSVTIPAGAEELRDFCPTRPGLGTGTCTVDPGHAVAEMSFGDWTRETDGAKRTDTLLLGDLLLRAGVGETSELQFRWTPYGRQTVRDRGMGTRMRQSRVGDVTLGLRQNLANPDGSGLSVAVQPFVSLPVGRTPIGAGNWGAGLIVPVGYEIGEAVQLEFVPQVDAAVDADGHGRHVAAALVTGVSTKISKAITATFELQGTRDNDPSGHETAYVGAAALAWQPSDDLQFDVQANAGLNHNAPDVELLAGVARRF